MAIKKKQSYPQYTQQDYDNMANAIFDEQQNYHNLADINRRSAEQLGLDNGVQSPYQTGAEAYQQSQQQEEQLPPPPQDLPGILGSMYSLNGEYALWRTPVEMARGITQQAVSIPTSVMNIANLADPTNTIGKYADKIDEWNQETFGAKREYKNLSDRVPFNSDYWINPSGAAHEIPGLMGSMIGLKGVDKLLGVLGGVTKINKAVKAGKYAALGTKGLSAEAAALEAATLEEALSVPAGVYAKLSGKGINEVAKSISQQPQWVRVLINGSKGFTKEELKAMPEAKRLVIEGLSTMSGAEALSEAGEAAGDKRREGADKTEQLVTALRTGALEWATLSAVNRLQAITALKMFGADNVATAILNGGLEMGQNYWEEGFQNMAQKWGKGERSLGQVYNPLAWDEDAHIEGFAGAMGSALMGGLGHMYGSNKNDSKIENAKAQAAQDKAQTDEAVARNAVNELEKANFTPQEAKQYLEAYLADQSSAGQMRADVISTLNNGDEASIVSKAQEVELAIRQAEQGTSAQQTQAPEATVEPVEDTNNQGQSDVPFATNEEVASAMQDETAIANAQQAAQAQAQQQSQATVPQEQAQQPQPIAINKHHWLQDNPAIGSKLSDKEKTDVNNMNATINNALEAKVKNGELTVDQANQESAIAAQRVNAILSRQAKGDVVTEEDAKNAIDVINAVEAQYGVKNMFPSSTRAFYLNQVKAAESQRKAQELEQKSKDVIDQFSRGEIDYNTAQSALKEDIKAAGLREEEAKPLRKLHNDNLIAANNAKKHNEKVGKALDKFKQVDKILNKRLDELKKSKLPVYDAVENFVKKVRADYKRYAYDIENKNGEDAKALLEEAKGWLRSTLAVAPPEIKDFAQVVADEYSAKYDSLGEEIQNKIAADKEAERMKAEAAQRAEQIKQQLESLNQQEEQQNETNPQTTSEITTNADNQVQDTKSEGSEEQQADDQSEGQDSKAEVKGAQEKDAQEEAKKPNEKASEEYYRLVQRYCYKECEAIKKKLYNKKISSDKAIELFLAMPDKVDKQFGLTEQGFEVAQNIANSHIQMIETDNPTKNVVTNGKIKDASGMVVNYTVVSRPNGDFGVITQEEGEQYPNSHTVTPEFLKQFNGDPVEYLLDFLSSSYAKAELITEQEVEQQAAPAQENAQSQEDHSYNPFFDGQVFTFNIPKAEVNAKDVKIEVAVEEAKLEEKVDKIVEQSKEAEDIIDAILNKYNDSALKTALNRIKNIDWRQIVKDAIGKNPVIVIKQHNKAKPEYNLTHDGHIGLIKITKAVAEFMGYADKQTYSVNMREWLGQGSKVDKAISEIDNEKEMHMTYEFFASNDSEKAIVNDIINLYDDDKADVRIIDDDGSYVVMLNRKDGEPNASYILAKESAQVLEKACDTLIETANTEEIPDEEYNNFISEVEDEDGEYQQNLIDTTIDVDGKEVTVESACRTIVFCDIRNRGTDIDVHNLYMDSMMDSLTSFFTQTKKGKEIFDKDSYDYTWEIIKEYMDWLHEKYEPLIAESEEKASKEFNPKDRITELVRDRVDPQTKRKYKDGDPAVLEAKVDEILKWVDAESKDGKYKTDMVALDDLLEYYKKKHQKENVKEYTPNEKAAAEELKKALKIYNNNDGNPDAVSQIKYTMEIGKAFSKWCDSNKVESKEKAAKEFIRVLLVQKELGCTIEEADVVVSDFLANVEAREKDAKAKSVAAQAAVENSKRNSPDYNEAKNALENRPKLPIKQVVKAGLNELLKLLDKNDDKVVYNDTVSTLNYWNFASKASEDNNFLLKVLEQLLNKVTEPQLQNRLQSIYDECYNYAHWNELSQKHKSTISEFENSPDYKALVEAKNNADDNLAEAQLALKNAKSFDVKAIAETAVDVVKYYRELHKNDNNSNIASAPLREHKDENADKSDEDLLAAYLSGDAQAQLVGNDNGKQQIDPDMFGAMVQLGARFASRLKAQKLSSEALFKQWASDLRKFIAEGYAKTKDVAIEKAEAMFDRLVRPTWEFLNALPKEASMEVNKIKKTFSLVFQAKAAGANVEQAKESASQIINPETKVPYKDTEVFIEAAYTAYNYLTTQGGNNNVNDDSATKVSGRTQGNRDENQMGSNPETADTGAQRRDVEPVRGEQGDLQNGTQTGEHISNSGAVASGTNGNSGTVQKAPTTQSGAARGQQSGRSNGTSGTGVQAKSQGATKSQTKSSGKQSNARPDAKSQSQTAEAKAQREITATIGKDTAPQVKRNDVNNIKKTLPVLLADQIGDILQMEKRFFEAAKQAFLVGNGTGTGKTFVGLGAIVRHMLASKEPVLVVVPSTAIKAEWVKDTYEHFGIDNIHEVKNSNDIDATKINITTYGSMVANPNLIKQNWGMVVCDEAHHLASGQDTYENHNTTAFVQVLRGLTGHDSEHGFVGWRRLKHPDVFKALSQTRTELEDVNKKMENYKRLGETAKANIEAQKSAGLLKKIDFLTNKLKALDAADRAEHAKYKANAKNGKVLFLSATPFEYSSDVYWAEGYLFNYDDFGGYDNLMKNKLGLDIRNVASEKVDLQRGVGQRPAKTPVYKKNPEKDLGRFERAFHYVLKATGAFITRRLQTPMNYSRKFIVVSSDETKAVIEGVRDVVSSPDYSELGDIFSKRLKGTKMRRFFEIVKTKALLDDVEKCLANGEHVLFVHKFKKSDKDQDGGNEVVHPFKLTLVEQRQLNKQQLQNYEDFCASPLGKKLQSMPLDTSLSIPEILKQKFGDAALVVNGDVNEEDRKKAIDSFNEDVAKGQRGKLLVATIDSIGEGVSAHDKTGGQRRKLINVAIPEKPSDVAQVEARIFRWGQKSNAQMYYVTSDTPQELMAYVERASSKAESQENLSVGDEARYFVDSFNLNYLRALVREAQGNRLNIADDDIDYGSKEEDSGRDADGNEIDFDALIAEQRNILKSIADEATASSNKEEGYRELKKKQFDALRNAQAQLSAMEKQAARRAKSEVVVSPEKEAKFVNVLSKLCFAKSVDRLGDGVYAFNLKNGLTLKLNMQYSSLEIMGKMTPEQIAKLKAESNYRQDAEGIGGLTAGNIIFLTDLANGTTPSHELMHFVYNVLLSPSQQKILLGWARYNLEHGIKNPFTESLTETISRKVGNADKVSFKGMTQAQIDARCKEYISDGLTNLIEHEEALKNAKGLTGAIRRIFFDIQKWFANFKAQFGKESALGIYMKVRQGQVYDNKQQGEMDTTPQAQLAGENSRTADKEALKKAKKLQKEGVPRKEIFMQTGWYQGKDEGWRYWLKDDVNAIDFKRLANLKEGEKIKLSELYKNDDLYKAYPELADFNIVAENFDDGTLGYANYHGKVLAFAQNQEPVDISDTLIHEIQHFIQTIEKWTEGASPDDIKIMVNGRIDNINYIESAIKDGTIEQDVKECEALITREKEYVKKQKEEKSALEESLLKVAYLQANAANKSERAEYNQKHSELISANQDVSGDIARSEQWLYRLENYLKELKSAKEEGYADKLKAEKKKLGKILSKIDKTRNLLKRHKISKEDYYFVLYEAYRDVGGEQEARLASGFRNASLGMESKKQFIVDRFFDYLEYAEDHSILLGGANHAYNQEMDAKLNVALSRKLEQDLTNQGKYDASNLQELLDKYKYQKFYDSDGNLVYRINVPTGTVDISTKPQNAPSGKNAEKEKRETIGESVERIQNTAERFESEMKPEEKAKLDMVTDALQSEAYARGRQKYKDSVKAAADKAKQEERRKKAEIERGIRLGNEQRATIEKMDGKPLSFAEENQAKYEAGVPLSKIEEEQKRKENKEEHERKNKEYDEIIKKADKERKEDPHSIPKAFLHALANLFKNADVKAAEKAGVDMNEDADKTKLEQASTFNRIKYLLSPGWVAETHEQIRSFVKLGLKAMRTQEEIRANWLGTYRKVLDSLKGSEEIKKLNELLYNGDAEEKTYTKEELKNKGVSDNVVNAYLKIRSLMKEIYKDIDNAHKHLNPKFVKMVKGKDLKKKLAEIESDKFNSNVAVKLNGDEEYTSFKDFDITTIDNNKNYDIAYMRPTVYKEHRTVLRSELDFYKADPYTQVVSIKDDNLSGSDEGFVEVELNRTIPEIKEIEGYMPHIFEEWLVVVETKDKNGRPVKNTIGSAKTKSEAAKLAKQKGEALAKAGKCKMEDVKVRPKVYDPNVAFGGTGVDEFLGYTGHIISTPQQAREFQNYLVKKKGLTAEEAEQTVREHLKMSQAHRFLGVLIERNGAIGYNVDMLDAMERYIKMTSRYIALEDFKSTAIPLYERTFGTSFDLDAPSEKYESSSYIKRYIQNINGTPNDAERFVNNVMRNIPWLKNHLISTYGDRVALSIGSNINHFWATVKLCGISSGLVNMLQLSNTYAFTGAQAMAKGIKGAYLIAHKPPEKGSTDYEQYMLYKQIVKDSGLETMMNMSDVSGYSKNRPTIESTKEGKLETALQYWRWLSDKGLYLFRKSDHLSRTITAIAAFEKYMEDLEKEQGGNFTEKDRAFVRKKEYNKAIEWSEEVLRKAMFDYGVADTSLAMQGLTGTGLGEMVMLFKKYPMKEMELMLNMAGMLGKETSARERTRFWATYALICGIGGIPLGDWIDEILEALYGYKLTTLLKANVIKGLGNTPEGKVLAKAICYGGLSALAGVDVSRRAGMADLLPTTSFLENVGGVTYSSLKQLAEGYRQGSVAKIIKAISPAVGNAWEAGEGVRLDSKGRLAYKYDGLEKIPKGMGFRLANESVISDLQSYEWQEKNATDEKRKAIMYKYAKKVADGEKLTAEEKAKLKENRVTNAAFLKAVKDMKKTAAERILGYMSKDKKKEYEPLLK